MKNFLRREKGFTLIEILIAISLLAILAAIIVPNLTGLIGRGQSESYKADKKAIQAAVDVYYTNPDNRASSGGQLIRQYPTGSGSSSDSPGYSFGSNSSYITMTKLVDQNLLSDFPPSSHSVMNGSTAFTGNYGWYVDSKGRVQSSPAYSSTIGYP